MVQVVVLLPAAGARAWPLQRSHRRLEAEAVEEGGGPSTMGGANGQSGREQEELSSHVAVDASAAGAIDGWQDRCSTTYHATGGRTTTTTTTAFIAPRALSSQWSLSTAVLEQQAATARWRLLAGGR